MMGEPITWGGILLANALYLIGAFLVVGILAILTFFADKWEEYKKKQPDWRNDWD
jgi:hypothetical protein